jgi:hypothetical protein
VNEARAAIVSSPYYATANTTLYAVWEDPNEVLEDAQISLGSTKIVIGNPDENTTDLQELQEAISELQALVQGTTEERTIETADGPVTETYTIYDALAIGDMSHRIEALTTSLSTTGNYLIVPELYFQYIPPANWGLEEKTVPVQTVMLLTPTSGSKTFEFELSGGAGGHMWARTNNTAVGGKGGYVKAQYAFTGVHTEYSFDIRVGGMGEGMAQYDGATGNYGMITAFPGGRTVESQHPGGGNGGGNGGAANTSTYRGGSGGGGATDIRPANDATSLSGCTTSDPRFLVAAGGGGAAQASGSPWNGLKGGDGGGDTGRIGQFGAGGSSYTMEASTQTSGFQPGIGEDGARGATLYEGRGGGGAGWWGGHAISSNTGTPTGGGAGGSSYVGTPTGGTIQGMSVNETLQANTWSDGWVLIKWVK